MRRGKPVPRGDGQRFRFAASFAGEGGSSRNGKGHTLSGWGFSIFSSVVTARRLFLVDTLSVRSSLNSMWPLVFSATQRPLIHDEVIELRRLSDLVKRGIPGREAFNVSAQALCRLVDSSGVFGRSNDPGLIETLLHQIDELRSKLE